MIDDRHLRDQATAYSVLYNPAFSMSSSGNSTDKINLLLISLVVYKAIVMAVNTVCAWQSPDSWNSD